MAFRPIGKYIAEIEIKKSRFIGIGYLISSVEEGRKLLKKIKYEYPDSRHICYGFLWGKKSTHMGMSDDGEPGGTAGRPILEVLKGSGYENILVAVVRYFGGTKLGTGGLVKAYTEIAKLIIDGIEVEEYVERNEKKISIPYGLYNQIKKTLEEFSCPIIDEKFLTDIEIIFLISKESENLFSEKISDISNGSLSFSDG